MLATYFRSSALSTLSMCEMQYFLIYNMGMRSKSNRAAVKGTITHRVMQALADKKKAQQEGKKTVDFEGKRLKLDKCDDLGYLTQLSFDHYTQHEPTVSLSEKDKLECLKWAGIAVSYNGGVLDPRNQNIHSTELFFDFEIDQPWAEYSFALDKKEISGKLALKGTIDLILEEDNNTLTLQDYKGLPIETEIPTIDGWKTMGDLVIGDRVFDQFGRLTQVTAKSRQKFKECYEIVFDDTSRVVCDDEHYWKLSDGSVVQVQDLKVGDKISVSKPIECEDKDLPIDPYILGIWLGDGRNRSGEITSGDKFIFEEIQKRGFELGPNQEKRKDHNCESRTALGLTTKLKKCGLTHNKHIPELYFRASYSQRLDLLRGLMDSDGSVNRVRRQCIFMNCDHRLSSDVKQLLLTLGQRPLISKTLAKGFGLEVDAFPVSFRPMNINPFLLPVKRNKVDKEWGVGHSSVRRIKSITRTGIKLTQCITVDSEDRTYLCTKNMIPTHNTGQRKNWATFKEKTYEDLEYDTQLLLYYYALKNIYPDKEFIISIYYINHGGLFSFVYDETHYKRAESMLRQKFDYVRNVEIPKMVSRDHDHPTCKYMCGFSQPFGDSGKSICQHFNSLIREQGVLKVVNDHADFNSLGKYTGGGRIDQ